MSKTRQVLDLLRNCESRNVPFVEPDGSWPIVWERAKGVHVWDADVLDCGALSPLSSPAIGRQPHRDRFRRAKAPASRRAPKTP